MNLNEALNLAMLLLQHRLRAKYFAAVGCDVVVVAQPVIPRLVVFGYAKSLGIINDGVSMHQCLLRPDQVSDDVVHDDAFEMGHKVAPDAAAAGEQINQCRPAVVKHWHQLRKEPVF